MTLNWKTAAACSLLALGVLHIAMGLVRFKQPFLAALSDGLLDAFKTDDSRRLAFWFTLLGPVLMLCGHLALRAAANGDVHTLGLIGLYLLVAALVGIAAFPASPLWALLVVAGVLFATGRGWLA
ncbi:hypothetical protein PMI14_07053 [Acidovorax sp. CF316]|uniref:DUF6463 family protein n=1 Tax=Acidovorax sp. CF316 TaxID=1144317 RepID=UPI00026BC041|nr:DUF6463 family protein [Acidovorax sp. CF316]EJE48531.1 hypothetical protein PMI14_07053 [Acidovorax sp. CF316]